MTRLVLLACALAACSSRASLPPPRSPLVATPSSALPGPPTEAMRSEPLEPPLERHELANGFRIVLSAGEPNGVVSVAFVSGATPRWDRSTPAIVTQWMAQMMFRATRGDDAVIDDVMEREGFSPQIEVGAEGLIVHDRIPREELPRWIRSLDRVLRLPAFRPADLRRRVQAHADRTEGELASSVGVLDDRAPGLLYGRGDPRSASVRERATEVGALEVDVLRARHADLLDPGRAALVVAGDVAMAELLPLIEQRFGAWPEHATTPAPLAPRYRTEGPRGIVVLRPALRSYVRVIDRAPSFGDPDYAAFLVLEQLLGGMFASRLNLSVREGSGASYGFHAFYGANAQEGLIELETSIEPGFSRAVVELVLSELRRVRGEGGGIEDRELAIARTRAREMLLVRVDTTLGLTLTMAQHVQVRQEPGAFVDVLRTIDRLDAPAIEAAARRWLRPERAPLFLVLRPEQADSLRELGLGAMEVVRIDR